MAVYSMNCAECFSFSQSRDSHSVPYGSHWESEKKWNHGPSSKGKGKGNWTHQTSVVRIQMIYLDTCR